MQKGKKYDLEDRLIVFAVNTIQVAESLLGTKTGNHIAKQLIRSGTSPAPNYGEAQGAESRADFIHKMRVSLKELRETKVWFRIIIESGLSKTPDKIRSLIEENNQLISIFVSSIRTAQTR